ncbi:MAG: ABC transporter permease subunit, partial [Aureliella sp.]
LSQADAVGPLFESLVTLERIEQRLNESAARAPKEFANDKEQAAAWRRLATTYQQQVLMPALESARAALESWRQEFAEQPTEIREALSAFEAKWHEVLEHKQPLEKQIQDLQAESEGMELAVLVPGDPLLVELSDQDFEKLQQGQWTESAQAALATHSLTPLPDSTQATPLSSQVTQVTFDDAASGRQALWCVERTPAPADAQQADAQQADAQQADAAIPDAAAATGETQAASEGSAAAVSNSGRVCLLTPQRMISCNEIVRLYPANRLTVLGKLGVYGSRWAEFLLDDPREANTEGGVFPAIWGTIVMTLIMTLAVVPFGVIAALYLREYTRSGPLVALVRISINNLAGVPSIVYGVFGLAFFCYSIGAFIDGGPKNAGIGRLPSGTWYMLLGLTALVGVIAFLFSLLSGGNQHSPKRIKRLLARLAPLLWFLSLVGFGVLVFKSPFFDGFYEARLPTPTFGKEGLIWASLTLALLTLPVVIVATEEALAAVPNSLREGSLACGASKWQTIYRIVLPHARPGILTGAILAMARGIGEVAPLMLVGALPVAPDLPLDTEFPYFHGSRSFMHLGYQIYWLGFQSQNSEASKPLVFTCTLLLLLIVVALNLSAILLRARLRRRFQGNQF